MRAGWAVLCLVCLCLQASAHYEFYRALAGRGAGRRVFGGGQARLSAWPAACALLDRYLLAHCSCSVLAPRWALTAAHCVHPAITYVQYNGHEPEQSNIAPVYLLYAHPEFHTMAKDRGYGMEVVLLRHDIGLVRTREDMRLRADEYSTLGPRAARAPPGPADDQPDEDPNVNSYSDPVDAVTLYNVKELVGHQINVLGFGVTEQKLPGEQLREVQLRLVACEQEGWLNCACAQGTARGVCAGDSGGPVVYNGTQIGVTSMGPLECGLPALAPGRTVRSVFTALLPYASVINATVHDAPDAFRMRVLRSAALRPAPAPAAARTLLGAVSLLLCRSF